MSERTTRVRRSAVGGNLHALLNSAHVGDRLDVTVYGAQSRVIITELTSDWVEVRTVEDEQRPAVSDLASWLLERIAEDEAAARDPLGEDSWHTTYCGWRIGDAADDRCVCGIPARVLAECEAKRRIVEWESDPTIVSGPPEDRQVLRLLALPYASHDGYRDEWRP